MSTALTIRIPTDCPDLPAARARVRELLARATPPTQITVCVPAGLYPPGALDLNREDCSASTRVIYQGESGAVIHGGLRIGKDEWQAPDEAMAARFSPEALPHIRMVSLTDRGLTRAEWGEEVPIGAFHTAMHYDGAPMGCGSAFFCGSRRMIKARYPDQGQWARIEAVADVGECFEFPPQNYYPERGALRELRGGTYIVDKATAARMKGWQDPSTAWLFGYFYWDWADASTPVTLHPDRRELKPRFVSRYGARAGQPYYLYNIPEELDSEGEWYLDRQTGNLYFWPWEGAQSADFAYSPRSLLLCREAVNAEISGFTLTCSASGAIEAEGEGLTFRNLTVTNIGDNAISVRGRDCAVLGCELAYLGGNGISLTGGDRMTLVPGNNRAEDNCIHDYAQISQTYRAAISLGGVGNIAAHNEIFRAPHAAILYSGNEHLIEYNDISDVVQLSHDAGAIYGGRDVAAHGTVIRYNRLRRIGSAEFHPHGIYWDDVLCGQTAYGNLLIDVGAWGFLVGGGRENVVENNLIVRSGGAGIQYDDRLRDGYLHGGWYGHWEEHIKQYRDRRAAEEPWASRYPLTAQVILDPEHDPQDPFFFINPSSSLVRNNLILVPGVERLAIAESVYRFSVVESNAVYPSAEAAGWDEEAGNLSPDSPALRENPAFSPIPVEKIGRRRQKEEG